MKWRRRDHFQKNTWYDWYNRLINYIPKPIKKIVGGVKGKIMSLFKKTQPGIIVIQQVSKMFTDVE